MRAAGSRRDRRRYRVGNCLLKTNRRSRQGFRSPNNPRLSASDFRRPEARVADQFGQLHWIVRAGALQ